MITVINDTPSGLYEGMTIDEAASQMVMECMEVFHDFEMDTLLNEHAYLFENGYEIEYMTEGKITDKGRDLIKAAQNMIDKARQIIAELWDHLVTWVQDQTTQFARALTTAGISKDLLSNTYNANKADAQTKINGVVSKAKNAWIFEEDFTNRIIGDHGYSGANGTVNTSMTMYGPNQYYKNEMEACKEESHSEASEIYITAVDMVYNQKSVVASIKAARKTCDDVLRAEKINVARDFKDSDETVYKEKMADLKARLNSNSNVARDKVKLYSTLVSESLKVVKAIVPLVSGYKNRVTTGASNAKAGVKNAGSRVAGAASTGASNVRNFAGDVKRKAGSLIRHNK